MICADKPHYVKSDQPDQELAPPPVNSCFDQRVRATPRLCASSSRVASKCCEHRSVLNRRIENATVRQLQSCAHPKFGEPQQLVVVIRREHDAGGVQIVSHRRALPYPHAADEYFGQRHGVDAHSPKCATEQDLGCWLMMWIGPIPSQVGQMVRPERFVVATGASWREPGHRQLSVALQQTGLARSTRAKSFPPSGHRHSRGHSRYCHGPVRRRDRFGGSAELRQRTILGSDYQHVPDATSRGRLCAR